MISYIFDKDNIIRVIKYLFSSGSSFVIDLILFSLFNYCFKNIFLSTVLARIFSSLYNYFINSRIVFKNYTRSSIFKYYLLVIIQMFVSAGAVSLVSDLLNKVNDIIIKFFVAMFPIKRVVLSNRKPTLELINDLFLCSDAFVSYV